MSATNGNDLLTGTAAANTINGLGGNDTIQGLGGADTLDGGDGDDRQEGGFGNDLLLAGDGADTLDGGAGINTVSYQAAVNLLPAIASLKTGLGGGEGWSQGDVLVNVQNLTGTDFAFVRDWLEGSDAANVLRGLAGDDTLIGLGGADSLFGGEGADRLEGGAGNDTLVGGAPTSIGADTLLGGDGDDLLDASYAFASIADGGDGLDTVSYAARTTGVSTSLLQDTVGGSSSELFISIENLTGTDHNDTLGGDQGANRLDGKDGNDLLYGLGGADTLVAGLGADTLMGGLGNDLLDAEESTNAVLRGGAGDDTYRVAFGGATVIEFANGGYDTVIAVGTWKLGANLEALILDTGIGAPNGTGNGLANTITGNFGGNVLAGLGGADTLHGVGGADTLRGGAGEDLLVGGWGNDRLEGGAGWDTARYLLDRGDVAIQRVNANQIRVGDPTGVDALFSVEALDLGGTTWIVNAPVVTFAAWGASGARATRIGGMAEQSRAGSVVTAAGDVDGDGFADLLVGAPGADIEGVDTGALYLILGRQGGWGGYLPIGGPDTYGLPGTEPGGGTGSAVTVLEDGSVRFVTTEINGPGLVRLQERNGRGDALLDGTSNTIIQGEAPSQQFGTAIASAGDVDGDGKVDLVIGAPGSGIGGDVFIRLTGRETGEPVESLDGPAMTRLSATVVGGQAGAAVAGGGDFTGDGFDDINFGAPGVGPGRGQAHIFLGQETGWGGTEFLGVGATIRLDGIGASDRLGTAVAVVGDVNGDGLADMLVGAPGADGGAGAAWLVFGTAAPLLAAGQFSIPLTGAGAIKLTTRQSTPDGVGAALAAAGDVNGDGFADMLVGSEAGGAYLVLGRANLTGGSVLTLGGANTVSFQGPGELGTAVSGAGDVDGDGLDDMLIGAPGWGGGDGAAWLVYGDHWLAA